MRVHSSDISQTEVSSSSSGFYAKDKCRFSIVVASYNYEKLILRNLRSLVNQSFRNYEIIVVDDGSKDRSLDKIKSFAEEFDNVKICFHPNNENRGLVETLKLGVSQAKGEYIAFCEADDYWDKEHLYFINLYLKDHPSAQIIANEIVLDNQSSFGGYGYYTRDLQNYLYLNSGKNIFHVERCVNRIPTFSAITIKKEALNDINWESPIPKYIDYWLYRQLTFRSPVFFCKEAITFWYKHDDSYDAIGKQEKLENFKLKSDEVIRERYRNDKKLEELTGNYSKGVEYSFLPISECGDPLVSIIIPICGVEKSLVRALNSALKQTYKNLEIILVYSSDNADIKNLIKLKNDSRIRTVDTHKQNDISIARNEGILAVRGDYVVFLDPDDYLDLNFVEELLIAIVSTEADVVTAATRYIRKDKTIFVENSENFNADCVDKIRMLQKNLYWNKLYSLKFLKKWQLNFPAYLNFGDYIFFIKVAYSANYIVNINSTRYNYCVQNKRDDADFVENDKLMRDALFAVEEICDFSKCKLEDTRTKSTICNYVVSSFIRNYRFLGEGYRNAVFDILKKYDFLDVPWTAYVTMCLNVLKYGLYKLLIFGNGCLRKKLSQDFLSISIYVVGIWSILSI